MSAVPGPVPTEPAPLLDEQAQLWRAIARADLVKVERLRQVEQELATATSNGIVYILRLPAPAPGKKP
jgi:hypothetical protein